MADRPVRKDWPGLPAGSIPDATVKKSLEFIDEFLRQKFGSRGNVLYRAPTWEEISASGLAVIDVPTGGTGGGGGGVVAAPTEPVLDTTPPGAPTGLTATAATLTVINEWDDPGSSLVSETEVWRASVDALGSAVRIGATSATLFADAVGDAGTGQYYWIRHISKAGVPGPFNAVGGTLAVPGAVDTAVIANAAIVTAKIADLAVATAKIANLAVTDAKIASLAVGKLLAGSIATGQYIQSSNYSIGVAGYRINADGSAEFQNITARGNILATSIAASVSITSPTISSGSISAASITGGSIYGTNIDTVTMTASVIRSTTALSTYTTPAGSRVASVSGWTLNLDLQATGTSLVFHVNGRWRLYADGRMEADEVVISRSNVVYAATHTAPALGYFGRWTPTPPVYDGSGDF